MVRLEVVDEECGSSEQAGLYDVCEWIVQTYPEDIFTSEKGHPVSKMRDLAKAVLAMRTKKRFS